MANCEGSDVGCWPWMGSKSKDGYGCFSARVPGRLNPAKYYAHRSVEEILRTAQAQAKADDSVPGPWYSPLPPPGPSVVLGSDETIDHLCWFTGCINPDHWTVETRAENTRKMRARHK